MVYRSPCAQLDGNIIQALTMLVMICHPLTNGVHVQPLTIFASVRAQV